MFRPVAAQNSGKSFQAAPSGWETGLRATRSADPLTSPFAATAIVSGERLRMVQAVNGDEVGSSDVIPISLLISPQATA